MKVSKDIVAQFPGMGFVVFVLESKFQFCHIHTAGAFRFAAFAGEAQVEGPGSRFNFLLVERR